MAELRSVRHGEYAGAVHVFLGGAHVGAIPREQADKFRPVVEALEDEGKHATCRAHIVGGHYEPDDEGWRNFGVWLLQPSKPAPFEISDPFLPPLSGHNVAWTAEHEPFLSQLLHSQAKAKRIALHGEVADRGGQWTVRIADRELGPVAAYEHVNAVRLREALARGFPLTCQVRVIREPDKPLRVAADLP